MVRTRLASVVPGSGCDCSTPTCALLGRRRARAAAHERASGARRLRLCWHCWLALLLLLLIPRVTASRLSQLHSFIVPCARALLPLRCLCPSVYTTPAEKRKRKKKGKHILRPRGDPHGLLDAASFPASDRTRLRHRSKGKAEQQQRARVELDPTPARCLGALACLKVAVGAAQGKLACLCYRVAFLLRPRRNFQHLFFGVFSFAWPKRLSAIGQQAARRLICADGTACPAVVRPPPANQRAWSAGPPVRWEQFVATALVAFRCRICVCFG